MSANKEKIDNIYRTLVHFAPELDSQDIWKIHSYIIDLLDDERNECISIVESFKVCGEPMLHTKEIMEALKS